MGKNVVGKIVGFVFHFSPDVEVLLMWALLSYERIREALEVTLGELEIIPVSSAISQAKLKKLTIGKRVLVFDTAGGKLDQHGDPRNECFSRVSSLDLLLEQADLRNHRPWLCDFIKRISRNDTHGRSISPAEQKKRKPRNEQTLRELVCGLNDCYRDDPAVVLEFGRLAFRGAFDRHKNKDEIVDYDQDSSLDEYALVAGVRQFYPDKAEWFEAKVAEAKQRLKDAWREAKKAVKQGRTFKVKVAGFGVLRGVMVHSDSFKVSAAGREGWRRKKGLDYHIVIHRPSDGSCQIYGNAKNLPGGIRKWIHFGQLAIVLQQAEAKCRGKRIAPDQVWGKSGVVVYIDGTPVEWYLPQYMTALFNRSLTAPDVSPTVLTDDQLMRLVERGLPLCDVMVEHPDGERKIISENDSNSRPTTDSLDSIRQRLKKRAVK